MNPRPLWIVLIIPTLESMIKMSWNGDWSFSLTVSLTPFHFNSSQYRALSNVTETPAEPEVQGMSDQYMDSSANLRYLDQDHPLHYPGHMDGSALVNFSDNNSDQTGQPSIDDPYWMSDRQDSQDSFLQLGSSSSSSSPSWTMVEQFQSQESTDIPSSLEWIDDQSITLDSTSKRPQRRGPFQDDNLREETSKTRRVGACTRCRMQKIRCEMDETDPTGPCQTCKRVSTQKIHILGCHRFKITDITLYRTGKAPGLEFTARWPKMSLKDISQWQNSEVRTISVLSDVCPNPLVLSVRKFVPIPKDSLKKSWMDGKVKKYKETTPFAIVDMKATVKDMEKFFDANVYICLHFFLKKREALIRDTYIFAWAYRKRAVSPPRCSFHTRYLAD